MWRWVFALLLVALAWVVVKDAAFNRFDRPSSSETPSGIDYSDPSAWIHRPADEPPGGWEKPWGVDVFLLLPSPRIASPTTNLSIEAMGSDDELHNAIVSAFETAAPVYAPAYRGVAPATFRFGDGSEALLEAQSISRSDISEALRSYLSRDNRFRAVLFVAYAEAAHFLPDLETIVRDTTGLADRTVGYVAVKAPSVTAQTEPLEYACMEGVERPCLFSTIYEPELPLTRFVLPQYPVRALPGSENPVSEEFLANLQVRMEAATTWLDTFATKPAPPLPPMEAIEVAPINRPGDDEIIED